MGATIMERDRFAFARPEKNDAISTAVPRQRARSIDLILQGSILPRISAALLGGIAERSSGSRLEVGVGAEGSFTVELVRSSRATTTSSHETSTAT